ncbi:adenylate/guanylate cyclase domain-containing protein [Patulibacter brassicae]|uniref:Adenylate/guanylate cyclase domain-containing protein n=1 Tax=Patulibacter brassicae TaxID=1705717 RepID=A0ABU4VL17_9ACTN|nr:adenylate/guanylate cyclase domain-containing protein [Patulibacter brassicae]MDX8152042.1 adenylate/guanylate cyclase domain-containing protein [Patulibacter brassicae]
MNEGTVHSFLFADLVGFTTLTALEGDERAADVAMRFFAAVRALPEADGAEEVKTLGDGLMLRTDDPERAVRLGTAIVARLDEGLEGFGSVPVRVGVHTGPAIARDGDWFGMAVNVAARLCAAAGDGEVLVSATTREAAVADDLVFGDARLHWLKNVIEPVAAHEVELVPEVAVAPEAIAATAAVVAPASTGLAGVAASAPAWRPEPVRVAGRPSAGRVRPAAGATRRTPARRGPALGARARARLDQERACLRAAVPSLLGRLG